MADLPTARVYPRDAKDRLAVACVHARRGGRVVSEVARLLWTFLLASIGTAYLTSRVIEWTEPRHVSYEEVTRPIRLGGGSAGRLELGDLGDRLEIVDVPSPTGHGTIKSLARKRTPPAPPPTVETVPPLP